MESIFRSKRLSVSLLILLAVVPFVTASYLAPTVHYRNAFYFADSTVANTIINTGHISVDLAHTPQRWGKILSRARQPVQPLFMAIGSIITGLPVYTFQAYLPLYMVLIGIYLIICKIFVDIWTSAIIAIGAAIGPNMKIVTSMGAQSIKYVIYMVIIYFALNSYRSDDENLFVESIIVPVLMILLLYNYPRLFILCGIFLVVLYMSDLRSNRYAVAAFIAPIGGYILVATPFYAYIQALIGVLEGLSNPDSILQNVVYIFGATNTGSTPWAIDAPSYTSITLPIPLIVGAVGGFVSIKRMGIKTLNTYSIIFLWGLSVLIFTIIQFTSGISWIASRAYVVAFPVMIVGVAVGLEYTYKRVSFSHIKIAISIIFVISMLSYFVLAAQSSSVDIQTYTHGEEAAGQWIEDRGTSNIISDQRLASLPAEEPPTGIYPRSKEAISDIFYSADPASIVERADTLGGNYLLISNKMYESGLYLPPSARRPIERDQRTAWNSSSSPIYDNGDAQVLLVE